MRLQSFTVQLDETDGVTAQLPPDLSTKFEPFFVDFVASKSAKTAVSFQVNGTIFPATTTLTFYTDCQKELVQCIFHPQELKAYGIFLIQEKIAFYTQSLRELGTRAKWELQESAKKFFGK